MGINRKDFVRGCGEGSMWLQVWSYQPWLVRPCPNTPWEALCLAGSGLPEHRCTQPTFSVFLGSALPFLCLGRVQSKDPLPKPLTQRPAADTHSRRKPGKAGPEAWGPQLSQQPLNPVPTKAPRLWCVTGSIIYALQIPGPLPTSSAP